jgi:hypothetical protein
MLCGVAKDLTKLGGKTVTKLVTGEEKQTRLFKLVSLITGWKNSLKGAGYFLGARVAVTMSYHEPNRSPASGRSAQSTRNAPNHTLAAALQGPPAFPSAIPSPCLYCWPSSWLPCPGPSPA